MTLWRLRAVLMGCCSSRPPVEADDWSPKYTETGAEGLHFANSHIQVPLTVATCFGHLQMSVCNG